MISTLERVLVLKSLEWFSRISSHDLAQLARLTREETFEIGEVVFQEGASGDRLYMVVAGQIRIHHQERVIAELGPPECFGEMALLDTIPRSATATAVAQSTLLSLNRTDFRKAMADRPDIAMGVIGVLTRRLREAIR